MIEVSDRNGRKERGGGGGKGGGVRAQDGRSKNHENRKTVDRASYPRKHTHTHTHARARAHNLFSVLMRKSKYASTIFLHTTC